MAKSVEQKFADEALVHLEALYGRALRLTGGDEAGAEELVREACREAYRSWGDVEPGTDRRPWLETLLRNAFLAEFRRTTGRRVRRGRGERVDTDAEEPGTRGAHFDRIPEERVKAAVDGLEAPFRVPLVLSDLEGLGYAEIADALGLPVRTAASRLHRARRRLRERLEATAAAEAAPPGDAPGERHGPELADAGGEDAGPPGGTGCDAVRSRVYEYLDGEMEPETQERVHRHVELCRRCHPYFDLERRFLDCVLEKGTAGERREGLERRVRRALEEEV